MPERTIEKLMMATEPAQAAQLAMIECLRQIADGNSKLNKVLEGVQTEVRDVRERIIRIEATEFKGVTDKLGVRCDGIEGRVTALERQDSERTGAGKALDAILKYGPFIIAIVTALFVVLVATKRIVL